MHGNCTLLDSLTVNQSIRDGNGMILVWTTQTSTQKVVSTGAKDPRKNYAFCGVNSICNYDGNVATCEYLRGFVPSSPGPWNIEVSSDGCVSKNKSNYSNSYTDSFFKNGCTGAGHRGTIGMGSGGGMDDGGGMGSGVGMGDRVGMGDGVGMGGGGGMGGEVGISRRVDMSGVNMMEVDACTGTVDEKYGVGL
ncbi:hypothetical protein JHK85_016912 [Glycine max]|nr:hypothetical protein JHK85_016912 [Glycine max]